MRLSRKKAVVVRQALSTWQAEGQLTAQQAATLDHSIEVQTFDWQRLARYSFWIALVSILTSVTAALMDSAFTALLKVIFDLPGAVHVAMLSALAGGFYFWGYRRTH